MRIRCVLIQAGRRKERNVNQKLVVRQGGRVEVERVEALRRHIGHGVRECCPQPADGRRLTRFDEQRNAATTRDDVDFVLPAHVPAQAHTWRL